MRHNQVFSNFSTSACRLAVISVSVSSGAKRSDDRFDVIFLCNVMLYFSQETRKTLLAGGTCHFRSRQPS
jgi:chemotaxis methyl-accepting protein methylase